MENFERESAHKQEKMKLWSEIITDSGITKEQVDEVQALLKRSPNPDFFISRFSDYLRDRNPTIFDYDDVEKKRKSYGYTGEIVLSEEDKTLYNLFQQLRSDK